MTQQTPAIFPNTGLASYGEASPEYELAPIGIASMPEQVKRLAEFGRNGDIYVIHAAQGETVIPMEVLDANPQIKALLFNQMQEMGIDPERYIVGNELNSINPVTGMPEFFLSSIFKSVKKAVKKVVKIAKQYAPVILPIAAAAFGIPFLGAAGAFPAFFGPASIGAAALSSGIGTLIAGGSVKDAFKSAFIAGGTTGILQGFEGMKGGKGWAGFKKGFTDAAYNPGYAELVEAQALQKAATDVATNVGTIAGADVDPASASGKFSYGQLGGKYEGLGPGVQSTPAVGALDLTNLPSAPTVDALDWSQVASREFAGVPGTSSVATAPLSSTDLYSNTYDALLAKNVPEQYAARQADLAVKAAADAAAVSTGPFLGDYSPTAYAGKLLGAKEGIPNVLANIGDIGLGLGAGAAAGMFKTEPPEDPEDVKEQALAALDPIVIDPLAAQAAQIDVTTQIPTTTAADLLQPSIFTAAHGGAVQYPRREALVEGPGTTTSDDIPAMLSDGEFVINSKAVQGADPSGMGNRYAGAQNLYNMMRNFEMRA